MPTKAQLEQRLESALKDVARLKASTAGYDQGVAELKAQLDRILAGVVRQYGEDVLDDDGVTVIGRRVILKPELMTMRGDRAHVAPSSDGYVVALMAAGGDADAQKDSKGDTVA